MKGRQRPRACEPGGEFRLSNNSSPLRILVVEDDIRIHKLSEEVLIHSGDDLNAAEGVAADREALETHRHNFPIPLVDGSRFVLNSAARGKLCNPQFDAL